eukprot:UN21928
MESNHCRGIGILLIADRQKYLPVCTTRLQFLSVNPMIHFFVSVHKEKSSKLFHYTLALRGRAQSLNGHHFQNPQSTILPKGKKK